MAASISASADKDTNRIVTPLAHGGGGGGGAAGGPRTRAKEPEEIARKITLSAALAAFAWNGHHVDLIDTPGYGTFIEETKGCLRVADGAVVLVSAISGVKTETERLWKFTCEYEVPRIAFVNKMDRDRANFFRAMGDREKAFVREGLAVRIPIGAEAGFKGYVDLVTMKAWTAPANGGPGPTGISDPEPAGGIPPQTPGGAAGSRRED